jgi:hypothetical protein
MAYAQQGNLSPTLDELQKGNNMETDTNLTLAELGHSCPRMGRGSDAEKVLQELTRRGSQDSMHSG